VGIRDNFFEMGGDSLKAIRLIVKIRAAFPACNPPLAALLKAPTVEQFAQTLGDGQADWSSLVAMRQGNGRPPFFCVPGGGGSVFELRDLAMALPPDQPFNGLQARGLDGKSAPFSSVEEAAQYYIDLIRKVQPRGPYYLGGPCYGGVVAFEMARRLRCMGETVSVLALIDATNPGAYRLVPRFVRVYISLLFLLRHALLRTVQHVKIICRMEPRAWSTYLAARALNFLHIAENRVRISLRYEPKHPPDRADAGLQALEGHDDFFEVLARAHHANLLAQLHFIPKPYDGHILLFRARTQEDSYLDEALGWRLLAKGGVTIYDIDGDHVSILRNPDVRALAEKLDTALREAQQATQDSNRNQEANLAPQRLTLPRAEHPKGVKADPARTLMDAEPVAGSSR
ncbi:MAG TPA: thioesterase domain-containing protein, partial [Terracidiphilus sp.]|nr:thioesterase domain-containing protein [Terracidiphilus sp.]